MPVPTFPPPRGMALLNGKIAVFSKNLSTLSTPFSTISCGVGHCLSTRVQKLPVKSGLVCKKNLTFLFVFYIISHCQAVDVCFHGTTAPLKIERGSTECSVLISPRSVIARWSTVSAREWLLPTAVRFWLVEELRAALV